MEDEADDIGAGCFGGLLIGLAFWVGLLTWAVGFGALRMAGAGVVAILVVFGGAMLVKAGR